MAEQTTIESEEKVKEYNFYYSPKREEEIRANEKYDGKNYYLATTFNGEVYSEMVEKGEKPIGDFNDYVLIGTGRMGSVTSKRINL